MAIKETSMRSSLPVLWKTWPQRVRPRSRCCSAEWIGAGSGSFSVIDPASGESVAEVPDASIPQFEHTIEMAARAMEHWRDVPGRRRAEILRRAASRVSDESAALVDVLTRE